MHVIGRRNDHGIDVLLIREHLAVVAMAFHTRKLRIDEAPETGVCGLLLPALVGRELQT